MFRPKIQILLDAIEKELKKAKTFAANTKTAAQEIARTAAHSPSQSGDREHSKNQAEIAEDYLKNLIVTKNLIASVIKNVPEKVEGNVFIKLEFATGISEEYYLVENPVKLEGLKLISINSPLGQALAGLRTGDLFSVKEPPLKGKIIELG